MIRREIFTNPGSPIHTLYGPKVHKDGVIELVEVGKENTDEYIQSFAESTDMSFILAKLAAGDTSVLQKRNAFYGDFSQVPGSFAEVLQMQIDAQNTFDHLPLDVKQKFDNDVNKFLASAGSDDWLKKMNLWKEDSVVDSVVEVKEKESEVTE